MKTVIKSFDLFCCATLPIVLQANLVDGLTVTGGQLDSKTLQEGLRIAPRWNWGHQWFEGHTISISGFWEASLGWWRDSVDPGEELDNNHEMIITSAGPTIQFNYNNVFPWNLHPYLEVGTGPSLSSHATAENEFVNSNFNMEDKIGAGFHLGAKKDVQLGYRFIHYSNQSVSQQNSPLDMHTINLTWLFS